MPIIDFSEGEIPDEFADCIKKGVESVFGMIFGDGPKYDGAEVEKHIGDGVVGIISFVGDLHWLLMVAFPRTSAENLISKFTGFEIKYDDPDMGDGVGELANMLGGDMVSRLAKMGIKVAVSLPSILRGHDVEPLLPKGAPAMNMHYSLGEDEFMLKIAGAQKGRSFGKAPGA